MGLPPLPYLFDLFVANSSDSPYNLRNTATDFKSPKKISSNGQKSVSYKGAVLWNILPQYSQLVSWRSIVVAKDN